MPAHIGTPTPGQGYEDGDPYAEFLPPPIATNEDGEADFLRAVVFVTEETAKGTARNGQEYIDPLLTLTGEEYAGMPFPELHERISNALRGSRPAVIFEFIHPDGETTIHFEDGTSRQVKRFPS